MEPAGELVSQDRGSTHIVILTYLLTYQLTNLLARAVPHPVAAGRPAVLLRHEQHPRRVRPPARRRCLRLGSRARLLRADTDRGVARDQAVPLAMAPAAAPRRRRAAAHR